MDQVYRHAVQHMHTSTTKTVEANAWLTKPVEGQAAANAKSKTEISREGCWSRSGWWSSRRPCNSTRTSIVFEMCEVQEREMLASSIASSTPHFASVVPLTSSACPSSTRRPPSLLPFQSFSTLLVAQPRPPVAFHRLNGLLVTREQRAPTWPTSTQAPTLACQLGTNAISTAAELLHSLPDWVPSRAPRTGSR
ncbi:MAG: hypothetical protein Q9173_006572 [Seirophora scorigena]